MYGNSTFAWYGYRTTQRAKHAGIRKKKLTISVTKSRDMLVLWVLNNKSHTCEMDMYLNERGYIYVLEMNLTPI